MDYQPEQADIDQINTFIKQTKSEIVNKTPVREKSLIYENPDVLNEIEKAYSSHERDKKKKEDDTKSMSAKTTRTVRTKPSSRD